MLKKIKAGLEDLKRNFRTREKSVRFLDRLIRANLYVMIFCLPFSKAIIEITATIAILSWAIKKLIRKEFKLPQTHLNAPIFLFLSANLVSLSMSVWHRLSMRNFLFKTMEYVLIYFVVFDSFRKKRQIHKAVYTILAIASISAFDGLFQAVTHRELLRGYGWAWVDSIGRIGASFNIPADFGAYIITVLPVIFLLALMQCNPKKFIFYSASFLLALCLFLTFSRSAWLGFIFSVIFMWVICDKMRKRIFLIVFLALMAFAAIFAYFNIGNHITIGGGSLIDRMQIWRIGWSIFRDSPIFGRGPGTFMFNFGRYKPESYLYIVYAHNCYLQMLAEIGVVGLLSFLWIIIAFFRSALISIADTKDGFYKLILIGSTSGIFAYLIQAALDTNLYSLPLAVLFWFMMGFVMAVVRLAGKNRIVNMNEEKDLI